MANSTIFSIGTFASAFIGAVLGVTVDRLWRRFESRSRLRVQIGLIDSVQGRGRTLSVENVGLNPIPEYAVSLFHPHRGTLNVFRGDDCSLAFPQEPAQSNRFVHYPRSHTSPQHSGVDLVASWFLHACNKPISSPSFTDFELRLVLINSERVLFRDGDMGNSLAKLLYEDTTGQKVDRPVKEVWYISQEPIWRKVARWYNYRHMLRRIHKQAVKNAT